MDQSIKYHPIAHLYISSIVTTLWRNFVCSQVAARCLGLRDRSDRTCKGAASWLEASQGFARGIGCEKRLQKNIWHHWHVQFLVSDCPIYVDRHIAFVDVKQDLLDDQHLHKHGKWFTWKVHNGSWNHHVARVVAAFMARFEKHLHSRLRVLLLPTCAVDSCSRRLFHIFSRDLYIFSAAQRTLQAFTNWLQAYSSTKLLDRRPLHITPVWNQSEWNRIQGLLMPLQCSSGLGTGPTLTNRGWVSWAFTILGPWLPGPNLTGYAQSEIWFDE